MVDLFVELFPIELERIPPLAAYGVTFAPQYEKFGGKLAYQLSQVSRGTWVWTQQRLVTSTPLSDDMLAQTWDMLSEQVAEIKQAVEAIQYDPNWQPNAKAAADFMLQTEFRSSENTLRETLKRMSVRIPNAIILREARLSTWVVDDLPSIALSISSRLLYEQDLQQYLQRVNIEELLDLTVVDKTSASMIASIKGVQGKLAEHRERLLQLTKRPVMQRILRESPDDAEIIEVESGFNPYDYVATALQIIVHPQHYDRFRIDPEIANKNLRLAPDTRAQMVRVASDLLKQQGLIGNAYNSRNQSDIFRSLDFMPSLEFGNSRVRPYKSESLATDFVQNGMFGRHPGFKKSPIRIALINTLGDTITQDFMEAMRRQLEKDFDFSIEMVRERNVRVLSQNNLSTAIRALEKENPHVLLAFFPDASSTQTYVEALKSLTIGKGIASHIVYETTMHNPDAMALVIIGILAKTGNIPYALAEPLDYAHLIVGLDWVREQLTRGDRLVGLSRIYRRDGMFMHYFMDTVELDTGKEPPGDMLHRLFPEAIFKGKQVIIHHAGTISNALLEQLENLAEHLKASFYPVEILQTAVPRLYALDAKVTQAPWGSVFLLSDSEAFAVSSIPSPDSTARPLHIRVPLSNLPIEQAVYSVLAWTLLHYGTLGTPRLPVTIQNADKLAEWFARGMLPEDSKGDVPFWL